MTRPEVAKAVVVHPPQTFDQLIGLQHRYPAWAAWVDGTGRWTATRAKPYQAGDALGPSLLWVDADNADQLAEQMKQADATPDHAGAAQR